MSILHSWSIFHPLFLTMTCLNVISHRSSTWVLTQRFVHENPIIVYCLKQQKLLPHQNYLGFITLIISDLRMLQRSWYVTFCSAFCSLLSQVQFFSWTHFYSVFAICILLKYKTMFHNCTQLNILYLNIRLYVWYHYVVTWHDNSDTLELQYVLWHCEINIHLIDSLC